MRTTLSNRDYKFERKRVQYVRNGLCLKRRWLVVALAVFYFAVVFGGASLKNDYSHISQYISELNASGSAWDWQIGYFGFLPLGLLGFVLLLVVRSGMRLGRTSGIGYWLLIGEPIAYAASAFAPCDLGCPSEGSLSQYIHNAVSVITLLMTTSGLVLLSFNETLSQGKRIGWLVLAATFIGLYGLALMPELDPIRGLLQRLAEGILYGSLWILSWRLLSNGRSDS